MLDLDFDLSKLIPAPYNPRTIDAETSYELDRSIATLGLIKPIIARSDMTIVAGHQRHNSAKHINLQRGPVYVLPPKATKLDEVRFNQLHNGTDLDHGAEHARLIDLSGRDDFEPGWTTRRVAMGDYRSAFAPLRGEIAKLISKFGNWGSCVATQNREIINGAQYALTASLIGSPLACYIVHAKDEAFARTALNRSYGAFNYDGIERATYMQTLAAMSRNPLRAEGKKNASMLYDRYVIPWLEENLTARVLDFGSGRGDYASVLRDRGYRVFDLELFRRTSGNRIDPIAIKRMIDELCVQLSISPFDAIVCDSVLNSCDSKAAEYAVMMTLNAFLKMGGTLFISGRPLAFLETLRNTTKSHNNRARRGVEFPDKDGLSGIYREGQWFFQKYHTSEQVERLMGNQGFGFTQTRFSLNSWQTVAQKVKNGPSPIPGILFEFNQALGPPDKNGKVPRLDRARDVLKALGLGD